MKHYFAATLLLLFINGAPIIASRDNAITTMLDEQADSAR